jgi:hypothetical protein
MADGGGGGEVTPVCTYFCRIIEFDEYMIDFRWTHQDYPDVDYPADIEFMYHCEGLPDTESGFITGWTVADGIYSGEVPVPSDVFCNVTLRAYHQGFISDNSNSRRRFIPREFGKECGCLEWLGE